VIRQIRYGRGALSPWLVDLLKRKAPKLAAVALANKIARIAWKLMVSGQTYRANGRGHPQWRGQPRVQPATGKRVKRYRTELMPELARNEQMV